MAVAWLAWAVLLVVHFLFSDYYYPGLRAEYPPLNAFEKRTTHHTHYEIRDYTDKGRRLVPLAAAPPAIEPGFININVVQLPAKLHHSATTTITNSTPITTAGGVVPEWVEWGFDPPPTAHFSLQPQHGDGGSGDDGEEESSSGRQPFLQLLHQAPQPKAGHLYLVFAFRIRATAELNNPKMVKLERWDEPATQHVWVYELPGDKGGGAMEAIPQVHQNGGGGGGEGDIVDGGTPPAMGVLQVQGEVVQRHFEEMVNMVVDHILDVDVDRYMEIRDYFEKQHDKFEERRKAWEADMHPDTPNPGLDPLIDRVHKEESCASLVASLTEPVKNSQKIGVGSTSIVYKVTLAEREGVKAAKEKVKLESLPGHHHNKAPSNGAGMGEGEAHHRLDTALEKVTDLHGSYALKVSNQLGEMNQAALLQIEKEKLLLYAMSDDCGQVVPARYICTYDERQKQSAILMPYIAFGDTITLVHSSFWKDALKRNKLWPHVTREFVADVWIAVTYLHANRVIHRDLKADNVLYDAKQGRFYVSDFGMSAFEWEEPRDIVGTLAYLAPETIRIGSAKQKKEMEKAGEKKKTKTMEQEEKQTAAVDAWAVLGMIYSWVEQAMPFEVYDKPYGEPIVKATCSKIIDRSYKLKLDSAHWNLVPELRDIMAHLQEHAPDKRKKVFDQLDQHPFFTNSYRDYVKKRYAGLIRYSHAVVHNVIHAQAKRP